MSHSRELSKGHGEADRGWLSWRHFAGVLAFVALFAALVVWTTVAVPGPIAYFDAEVGVAANVEVRAPTGVQQSGPRSAVPKAGGQASAVEEAQ